MKKALVERAFLLRATRSARGLREAAVAGERVGGLAGHDLAVAGQRLGVDAEGGEAGGVVVAKLGDGDRAIVVAHELGEAGGRVALLAELGAETRTVRTRGRRR